MRIIIRENEDGVAKWVAAYMKYKINEINSDRYVLGLPTGSTPIKLYTELSNQCKIGQISFKNVTTFNMDEYVGLERGNPNSYYYFMHKYLFNNIDIDPNNVNILNGCVENLTSECNNYEEKIKNSGGIDLFLCGIGADGHLAFNEPGSSLTSRTRVKTLCYDTIDDNSRFFKSQQEVPNKVLTVGLQTIMDSKEIIVMVTGRKKAIALQKCIEENINHMWTASILQTHQNVIFVCDEAATMELKTKTVKYFKELQKTTNLIGQPIDNHYFTNIKHTDNILIFSPHPDDDVIGCGGVLQLFPNKKNVKVVYMTSGKGGLRKDQQNQPNIREKEAIVALNVLGYDSSAAVFANLPFYDSNGREITDNDTDHIVRICERYDPQHIYICGDTDPNGTHEKCYNIIKNALSRINEQYDARVWIYKGAWGSWNGRVDPNCTVLLESNIFNLKEASIKCHQSQDPPVVSFNSESFTNRVKRHNFSTEIFEEYQEQFKVLTIEDFISYDSIQSFD